MISGLRQSLQWFEISRSEADFRYQNCDFTRLLFSRKSLFGLEIGVHIKFSFLIILFYLFI